MALGLHSKGDSLPLKVVHMHLVVAGLSCEDVGLYYEGFSLICGCTGLFCKGIGLSCEGLTCFEVLVFL